MGSGFVIKVASTAFVDDMFTVQIGELPQLGSLQPWKSEPSVMTARSVIDVLCMSDSVQSIPQLIPVPVTVPAPLPESRTVRVCRVTSGVKLAKIVVVQLAITVQVALLLFELQGADHPENTEPLRAVALSVTVLPSGAFMMLLVQLVPQSTPDPLIVPPPDPVLLTTICDKGIVG